jgi:hypothetical protein
MFFDLFFFKMLKSLFYTKTLLIKSLMCIFETQVNIIKVKNMRDRNHSKHFIFSDKTFFYIRSDKTFVACKTGRSYSIQTGVAKAISNNMCIFLYVMFIMF